MKVHMSLVFQGFMSQAVTEIDAAGAALQTESVKVPSTTCPRGYLVLRRGRKSTAR